MSKDLKEMKERTIHLSDDEHLKQTEGECNSSDAGTGSIPGSPSRRTEATVAGMEGDGVREID